MPVDIGWPEFVGLYMVKRIATHTTLAIVVGAWGGAPVCSQSAPEPRPAEARSLIIELANGDAAELEAKQQLERLQDDFDIERWLFTDQVRLDSAEPIPHSHPVLTLNADYVDNDLAQLATLLHEQFHWWNGPGSEGWRGANAEFEQLFPDAPKGLKEGGARDARSTISHLIICDLEFQAMTLLVGEEKARETLAIWEHYPWIYQQVLTNPKVREVNTRHGWVVADPVD